MAKSAKGAKGIKGTRGNTSLEDFNGLISVGNSSDGRISITFERYANYREDPTVNEYVNDKTDHLNNLQALKWSEQSKKSIKNALSNAAAKSDKMFFPKDPKKELSHKVLNVKCDGKKAIEKVSPLVLSALLVNKIAGDFACTAENLEEVVGQNIENYISKCIVDNISKDNSLNWNNFMESMNEEGAYSYAGAVLNEDTTSNEVAPLVPPKNQGKSVGNNTPSPPVPPKQRRESAGDIFDEVISTVGHRRASEPTVYNEGTPPPLPPRASPTSSRYSAFSGSTPSPSPLMGQGTDRRGSNSSFDGILKGSVSSITQAEYKEIATKACDYVKEIKKSPEWKGVKWSTPEDALKGFYKLNMTDGSSFLGLSARLNGFSGYGEIQRQSSKDQLVNAVHNKISEEMRDNGLMGKIILDCRDSNNEIDAHKFVKYGQMLLSPEGRYMIAKSSNGIFKQLQDMVNLEMSPELQASQDISSPSPTPPPLPPRPSRSQSLDEVRNSAPTVSYGAEGVKTPPIPPRRSKSTGDVNHNQEFTWTPENIGNRPPVELPAQISEGSRRASAPEILSATNDKGVEAPPPIPPKRSKSSEDITSNSIRGTLEPGTPSPIPSPRAKPRSQNSSPNTPRRDENEQNSIKESIEQSLTPDVRSRIIKNLKNTPLTKYKDAPDGAFVLGYSSLVNGLGGIRNLKGDLGSYRKVPSENISKVYSLLTTDAVEFVKNTPGLLNAEDSAIEEAADRITWLLSDSGIDAALSISRGGASSLEEAYQEYCEGDKEYKQPLQIISQTPGTQNRDDDRIDIMLDSEANFTPNDIADNSNLQKMEHIPVTTENGEENIYTQIIPKGLRKQDSENHENEKNTIDGDMDQIIQDLQDSGVSGVSDSNASDIKTGNTPNSTERVTPSQGM